MDAKYFREHIESMTEINKGLYERFQYEGQKLVSLAYVPFEYILPCDNKNLKPVTTWPIGDPEIIENIPRGTTYRKTLELFEKYSPDIANAFITGREIPSSENKDLYHVSIQYFKIPDEDWNRAQGKEQISGPFFGQFRPLIKQEFSPPLNC